MGRLHLEERCPIVHRFLDLPSAVAACGGFAILVINVAAIAYATQVYSMLCLYSPPTHISPILEALDALTFFLCVWHESE